MPAVILSKPASLFILMVESHRSLLMGKRFQCERYNKLFPVVCRLVGGAQTSLRRHGELGAECVRGAEDPAGRRGVVVVLSDGADDGGRPRDLPPGRGH